MAFFMVAQIIQIVNSLLIINKLSHKIFILHKKDTVEVNPFSSHFGVLFYGIIFSVG